MDRLLFVTSVGSCVLIFMVLQSLRRAHIRVEYSISWLAAGFGLLLLSRWESGLIWLSKLFGVTYPPAALLGIAFGILLLMLYRVSMVVSELKDNNIALAQKVAILEYRLQSVSENEKVG
jgi:hypothetical protein